MAAGDYVAGAALVVDTLSLGWTTNGQGARDYNIVVSYHVQLKSGDIGKTGSFSYHPGAAGQTQLDALYNAAVNAAKTQEGA